MSAIGYVSSTVEYIGLLSTRIRLWDGTVATLPNDKVLSEAIHNHAKSAARK